MGLAERERAWQERSGEVENRIIERKGAGHGVHKIRGVVSTSKESKLHLLP